MDRFRWCSDAVEHRTRSGLGEESVVLRQAGIRLYDGPERTTFDNGLMTLTTHRIVWHPSASPSTGSKATFLALPLVGVLNVRGDGIGGSTGGGLLRGTRTPKLVLRLTTPTALSNTLTSWAHPLPWLERWHSSQTSLHAVVAHSAENHVKLGFTRGGEKEFLGALEATIQAKLWAAQLHDPDADPDMPATQSNRFHRGGGIGAVEREQAARAGEIDMRLEDAFDDLDRLMQQATEIVQISRALATQTREVKDGSLSTDETAELRAAMLSMGIDASSVGEAGTEPSTHSSSASFHTRLAHDISRLITPMLTQRTQTAMKTGDSPQPSIGAGCIDLAAAYCRVNRARGMELVSPDDLMRACRLLEMEKLPLRLKSFPSGLLILHLASENETETLTSTSDLVRQRVSLTADELARAASLSTLLARERLLAAECAGFVCRDDSEAGLRFYPNRFLSEAG